MACKSSMLLTLKAPSAYLPLSALANRSLVCVSGIVLMIDANHRRWRIIVLAEGKEMKLGAHASTQRRPSLLARLTTPAEHDTNAIGRGPNLDHRNKTVK